MADKNYKLKFTLTDGKTQEVEFTAPQGPKGDQGVQGVQGPAGAKGDKGDQGIQGIQGPKGDTGESGTSVTIESTTQSDTDDGYSVITFSDGTRVSIKNGSKGSTGSQGPKGDKGDTGPTGPKGDPGDSKVAYAICDTAAATAAKVAAISGNDSWTLQVGSIVMVYFSISNTAKNVTLNVNDSGAYPIWYNNAEYASNGTAYTGYAKRVIIYMFNGTHWVWIGASYEADTNTYQRLYVTTGSAEYPITTRYNTTTGNSYYAEYGRYSEGVTLNPSTNTITATAFKGKLTGNADTATKATQDGSGNNIANTYAKKSSAETWTFTLEDDTVVTKKVVLA